MDFDKNNIKLILFDIGAVLIEYGDVFNTVAKEQNFEHELIDNTFDKYDSQITTGKISPQELYLRCLEENNINADKNYDFAQSWIKDYKPLKETYELIEKLKANYEIGYLSNIYKGLVEKMISQKMLPNLKKEFRFLSCDIGAQKPDEEIYKYVEENVEFKPSEILFIDDKVENLDVARARNWNTFEFTRYKAEENVKKLERLLL